MNGSQIWDIQCHYTSLDSITADLLIQNGLGNQYYIDIINLKTGEKISGIGTQKNPSFMVVKPKYFPIRSDYTQVVPAYHHPIPIGFFWSVWDYSL